MLRAILFRYYSWRADRAAQRAADYCAMPAGRGWSCGMQLLLDRRAARLAYIAGTYA